jgi:HlyD family secretion protein
MIRTPKKFLAWGGVALGVAAATVGLGHRVQASRRHHPRIKLGFTPVIVAKAQSGTVSSRLTLTGVVEAQATVNVVPLVTGRIAQLDVQVGEHVSQGQTIATLSNGVGQAQLAEAQAAVSAAQAKVNAATAGPTPQAVAVAQAALQKAVVALQNAKTQYQAAVANYQDRAPQQQALTAAENQVKQAQAAYQVAEANVATAQVKLKQAQAQAQTSLANTLPSTITADQDQLHADQVALNNAETALSAAQQTLAQDQTLYSTLASQYPSDEAQYQEVLQEYSQWQGSGTNPYQAALTRDQFLAQQAQSAVNTLQSAQNQVNADQLAVAQAQKAVAADQATLQSAENQLNGVQQANALAVQAAQAAVQQAQAQANQSQTALQSADATLAAAQATFNDRAAQQQTLDQFQGAVNAAQAGVAEADAQLHQTEAPPSSATLAVLKASVAQAQAALGVLRAELARDVITAPFSGIITAVPEAAGAFVGPGVPIATLATTQLTVQASVAQPDLPLVNAGEPATVEVPGESAAIAARVQSVAPQGTATSMAFNVTLTVTNPPAWLKPGEFASVNVTTQTIEHAVIVPTAAVVSINGRSQVFVVKGNHQVALVNVTPSITNGADTMVSGIQPGMRVVVAGQTYLSNGARVHISQTVAVPQVLVGYQVGGYVTPPATASVPASARRKAGGA